MNMPDLLAHQSRKYPTKEAIITPTESVTYETWNKKVNQLAHALLTLGIERGDKVILHMPNTKEFLYTYFAVQRLGGIIVPVNAKLVANELTYILSHSEAKAFITHELIFQQVEQLANDNASLFITTGEPTSTWYSLEQIMDNASEEEILSDLNEDDEASILYTSGTTGDPKGVLFTYRNILTVARMICIEMTMKPESRVLHIMPLSHSAPLHLFMAAALNVGATHVVVPTFTPELLLSTVEKEKITHFFGAPIAYLASTKHSKLKDFDLSSMEYWVYGGAPLSQQEVSYIKQHFSTNRLACVYGLTEAGPSGTLLRSEEHDNKAGSIGSRAALHCELRLVDENGNDVKQGEIGEIILRGEGNMKGYYKNPEETANVLKGEWLYTGDMAMEDKDGYFWVVDRKKDIIISGGVNIFPQEIEKLIVTHPAIQEVAVVGVPNPNWGETVKAFIVADKPINEPLEELTSFLEGKLADYKIPKLCEQLEALPRNITGKLQKNQLRERIQQ
ncbi:Long-chain-fatty-acid--CoA ligase [Oceanobacillus picturae]|uniref:Long-chain-fatty-acid--CoA ligase n=2 Tax=Oceanobacillus picturae TaxID=171693 RepID=W9AC99_9BACI|nr:long-chain-fatty-acid--CoA ligase [Oceanobacillus picturae]CDO03359.1 Long-chain-fatty-acid--CoA ligase [Oceanobacillus picturae]